MKFRIAVVQDENVLRLQPDLSFQNTVEAEQWLRTNGEGCEGKKIAIVSIRKIVEVGMVQKIKLTEVKEKKEKKEVKKDGGKKERKGGD